MPINLGGLTCAAVAYTPPDEPPRPDPIHEAATLMREAIEHDRSTGMTRELEVSTPDYCAGALEALAGIRMVAIAQARTRANARAADAVFAVSHHYRCNAEFRAAFEARTAELLKEARSGE
ncbi:hypothetical protein FHX81_4108 [Saccharothrix saharensis]|uniref:Uncharacterized protein n=1 Tax=Saccharothrix saharensis TaxID=571190 RepID=A0A543JG56_9PSEU|nr:hypothetical protein [Saccharothrix saharensis]TQM81734.1 hypothetical protein FHX81_4108 [Saccharothrix saharensis]